MKAQFKVHYERNMRIQEQRKRNALALEHQKRDDDYWDSYESEDEDEDAWDTLTRSEKLRYLYRDQLLLERHRRETQAEVGKLRSKLTRVHVCIAVLGFALALVLIGK